MKRTITDTYDYTELTNYMENYLYLNNYFVYGISLGNVANDAALYHKLPE